MPGVGARFRAQVDNAAGELSPLGAQVVVLHLKFADRVRGRHQSGKVDVADIKWLTVQILGTLVRERSADLIVGKVEWVLTYR